MSLSKKAMIGSKKFLVKMLTPQMKRLRSCKSPKACVTEGKSKARMLSAAPGHCRTDAITAVPVAGTNIQCFGHRNRAFLISGINRRSQAVLSVAHFQHRFSVVLDFHDSDNWAKRLVDHYTHLVGNVRQDGGFEIIAFAVNFLAARMQSSSVLNRLVNLFLDHFQ